MYSHLYHVKDKISNELYSFTAISLSQCRLYQGTIGMECKMSDRDVYTEFTFHK